MPNRSKLLINKVVRNLFELTEDFHESVLISTLISVNSNTRAGNYCKKSSGPKSNDIGLHCLNGNLDKKKKKTNEFQNNST